MPATNETHESEHQIDRYACGVYATEIRNILGLEGAICIFSSQGRVLWAEEEFPIGTQPSAESRFQQLIVPTKSSVGHNHVAYDFPLDRSSEQALTLRVLIRDSDPPSLAHVADLIGPTVECLARQINIDTSLTSSRHHMPAAMQRELRLHTQIQSFAAVPDLQAGIESLAAIGKAGLDADCVAIRVASKRIMAAESNSPDIKKKLPELIARLQTSLEARPQITSARIAIESQGERHLICAPVFDRDRLLLGLVIAIGNETIRRQAKIVRLIANKTAHLISENRSSNKRLNRSELIDHMKTTQSAQPAIVHSLVYFDADKVHAINNTFGHSAGDVAVAKLGATLSDCAGKNDVVAHLTSDRYALFLPGATSDTAVAKATQALQAYSRESIDSDAKSIRLSASAGVATIATTVDNVENLLNFSEVAARAAKDRGGDQCALFQDVDDSIIQRRSDVDKVGLLQMALIEDRFTLFAQRIEAINREPAEKFELLMRLKGEDQRISHPADMLAAAERYHMMPALDRWVVNTALTSISNADNVLEVNLTTFCINVSAQSLQDDSFVDHIEQKIAETGCAPDTLCFEITETSLVKQIDCAQRFISRLQAMGCLVALDDFGTGYSSFAYLKDLPVNFLKIDGIFVRDLLENPLSRAIVSAVVQIAEVTGAATVAEHVENDLIKALLKDLGVHYAQGFSVHKPEALNSVLNDLGETVNDAPSEIEVIELGDYLSPVENRR